jgi:predicted GIY-YIG superfamily endonuclease
MNTNNGQSAAKPLSEKTYEEGSTTIPKGSTDSNIGKKPMYLRERYVIYKITNIKNSKIYIGSASYYDKRIGTHVSRLRRNTHQNRYLQSAWNKYGEEFFIFEIIEYSNKECLIEREQYWLDFYRSYDRNIGYNLATKAGSNLGYTASEEARKKISNALKGLKYTEEQCIRRKKQVTENQGKAVLVYDKNMNFIAEYPSISETSRAVNLTISAISKYLRIKLKGRFKTRRGKYIFKYKDIV